MRPDSALMSMAVSMMDIVFSCSIRRIWRDANQSDRQSPVLRQGREAPDREKLHDQREEAMALPLAGWWPHTAVTPPPAQQDNTGSSAIKTPVSAQRVTRGFEQLIAEHEYLRAINRLEPKTPPCGVRHATHRGVRAFLCWGMPNPSPPDFPPVLPVIWDMARPLIPMLLAVAGVAITVAVKQRARALEERLLSKALKATSARPNKQRVGSL